MNIERFLEIAKSYGVEIEESAPGEGGFYTEENGGWRRMEFEELWDKTFPDFPSATEIEKIREE